MSKRFTSSSPSKRVGEIDNIIFVNFRDQLTIEQLGLAFDTALVTRYDELRERWREKPIVFKIRKRKKYDPPDERKYDDD